MRTPARKRPADPTATTRSGQAAVVGGSIAGLLAAAVLAEHFEQVTVLDRDRLPASPTPRRGTPQAVHQHVLLAQGRRLLEELLPGLQDDLVAMGTPEVDMAAEVAWLTPAGWGARFPRSSSCSAQAATCSNGPPAGAWPRTRGCGCWMATGSTACAATTAG